MALDIERIEWWVQAEAIKLKLKQSLEEIERDKLFCRYFKLSIKPQDVQAEVVSEPTKIGDNYEYEIKLKNQNNEQDNKTDYKD